VNDLRNELNLQPHPEGGFFAEYYRSAQAVTHPQHKKQRAAVTSIYYLLPKGTRSVLHRIRSDEIWFHMRGDPLELSILSPRSRALEKIVLGQQIGEGQAMSCVVDSGDWFGATPSTGSEGYSLCACVVAPGFDFEDFEIANTHELSNEFPEHAREIARLMS